MEDAKSKLIAEADKLFMHYGLKSVSMDDIARQLGMSKKTLYQYVKNKEELIAEVMRLKRCEDMEVILRSAKDAEDAIDEYLRNHRYFIREMREVSPTTLYDLKKYYYHIWEEQVKGHVEEFTVSISQNIQRGIQEGFYREDLQPEVIAKIYSQTVLAIADTSLFSAREMSVDRIIHQHAVYHLHGIMNKAGRRKLREHLEREEFD